MQLLAPFKTTSGGDFSGLLSMRSRENRYFIQGKYLTQLRGVKGLIFAKSALLFYQLKVKKLFNRNGVKIHRCVRRSFLNRKRDFFQQLYQIIVAYSNPEEDYVTLTGKIA